MSCLVLGTAMPYPYPYALPDEPGYHPAPAYDAHIGRVKIQVSILWFIDLAILKSNYLWKAYRGPSKPAGGYDSFAPWGFYVTQPKDNFYGYGHH